MVSLSNSNYDRGAAGAAEAADAVHQGNGNLGHHHQQRNDGVSVNGLGPPPDLVVRPAIVDADAHGRAVPGGERGGQPMAAAAGHAIYPPVVAAAGMHPHRGVGTAAGQAAVLHVAAAAAIGCQVCGAGLLPVVGGHSAAGGRHHVVHVPQPRQRGAQPQDGAHPAAEVAAPVVVYGAAGGGGEDEVPQLQRQRANNVGAIIEPLPDLVNAHIVPTQAGQSCQPHHHHHHYYQENVQQCQQQDGGAEMMMLYDDPGRCWLSQCPAYRHGNPFAQYASSSGAATYGQSIYHRGEDRLCRANRASKLCDVNSGCCLRCVVAMTTVKWVMMAMASLGVGCIVIGVVLGVIQIAAGSGAPFSAGYLAHSLIFMGLGGTLVSVVVVVWRCALPEAERRQSCRLLSAIELADRVRWSTVGRPSTGTASTPAVNVGAANGSQNARSSGSGPRAPLQQHPPHVHSRAPVNGGAGAPDPRAAIDGSGPSSDYDYGYWCGGDQLCPEYRHPHNHHRYLTGRQVYTSNSSFSNQLPQQHQHQSRLQQLRSTAPNDRPYVSSTPEVGRARGRNADTADSYTSDVSRSASLSRRPISTSTAVAANTRSSSSSSSSSGLLPTGSATGLSSRSRLALSPLPLRRVGDRDHVDPTQSTGYRTLQPQRSRRHPMHPHGAGSDNDDIESDRDNAGVASTHRPPQTTAPIVKRPSRLMLQCVGTAFSSGTSAVADRGWATAPRSRRFQQLQQLQQLPNVQSIAAGGHSVSHCHGEFQQTGQPIIYGSESRRRRQQQQQQQQQRTFNVNSSWTTDADADDVDVAMSERAISINSGLDSRKMDSREPSLSGARGVSTQPSYSSAMQG